MINQIILNYKVLSFIGEGGMGSVYLAEHQTIGRKVAIKVLLPELAKNQQIRERFINEAKTLSKLNHQNIVSLYDFSNTGGNLMLVMEYVEGTPLDTVIEEITGAIPEQRCVNIFKQILDGFAYAHEEGIIHRDIKPSNIILRKNDSPKILDFGIAKILDGDIRLTKTGTRMGSVLYMSPEQVMGRDVDIRSDIYSLGVTLFEMLTGKLPYDSATESEFDIQNRIVREPLPPVRSLNPNISEKLEHAIIKATEKDVNHRFRSCGELVSAIMDPEFNYLSSKTTIQEPAKNKTVYQTRVKKKSYKAILYLFAGLSAIALIIILFKIFDKDSEVVVEKKNVQPTSQIELPKTDTKTNESKVIEKLIQDWIDATNNKSANLSMFYSNLVSYYTWGLTSQTKVINDKKDFFKKWDSVKLTVSDLQIQKINDERYECIYDKYYEVENFQTQKRTEGKVKSILTFNKENGKFVISEERDDHIYYTNKK